MKRLMAVALAAGAILVAGPATGAEKNVRFKNTCAVPAGSLKRSGTVRTFTLKHGQKGNCPTDRQARHSAPYWERAEVASTEFRKGKTYRFSVDIKFDPDTASTDRTTFFQVHQHNSKRCPTCYPAVMIQTKYGGRIVAATLTKNREHAPHLLDITRSKIAGKWTTLTIEMGTSPGMNPIAIFANGKQQYTGNVYVEPKGSIYLKSGIYRPGSTKETLPTDRVSMRGLRYEVVN